MAVGDRTKTSVTTDRARWSRSGRSELDLDDLRNFLDLCEGMPGDTRVTVTRELAHEGGSHTDTLEAVHRVESSGDG